MSRTLFWYIMRDLLRIFLMTSMVLAGIMSFGGLLKPLMQYGLSGTQVGQMLLYFMPATQTYSLPIAALFATTIVYGRLSADNELTACRAAGISYLTLAIPAFVLGLVLAITSLLSLSFVVPTYTLKVEKVAFSSLADIIQKSIQRSRQIKWIKDVTIYADAAELLPPADGSSDERVVLANPMFCLDEEVKEDDGKTRRIPSDFFMATSAEIRIRQTADQAECSATLVNGVRFPRNIEGSAAGGLAETSFGPFPIDSLIRENTKFMDITQLKEMDVNPLRSRKIKELYSTILRQEQEDAFLETVLDQLRSNGHCRIEGMGDEAYTVSLQDNTRRILLSGRGRGRARLVRGRSKLSLGSVLDRRDIRLVRERAGVMASVDEARDLTIRTQADSEQRSIMRIQFELADALVSVGEGELNRDSLSRPLKVTMPPHLAAMESSDPAQLLRTTKLKTKEVDELKKRLARLHNGIRSELHGRASFAVSCLILVTVGCALGMMFKTGNFLNAFALSVMPALLCIALIVTGQHVAENGMNSLKMGIAIIWSGNLMVLALAVALIGRLQKQ